MARILCDKAVELLADMPPSLAADPMAQGVINAFANEAQRIDAAARAINGALFPVQSDDVPLLSGRWKARMLSMWETLLNLPVDPAGASLADRRDKVLAHIQKRNSGAGSDWVAILTLALGSISWTYQEGPGDYQVTISIPYEPGSYSAAQVDVLAREITPAHLDIVTEFSGGFLIGISEIGIEPL